MGSDVRKLCLKAFITGLGIRVSARTRQAWMASEGVDLAVIGVFSLVGLPYAVKYLWAPVMDRFVPPFLGRRRGWMLVTQAALVVAVATMAFSDPKAAPGAVAVLCLLVAFFSASQDIVVDAWRTEVLAPEELGPGAGVHILGYRVAMLTSGAVALILADRMPWRLVYLLMAGSLTVGIAASLLSPEPEIPGKSLSAARPASVVRSIRARRLARWGIAARHWASVGQSRKETFDQGTFSHLRDGGEGADAGSALHGFGDPLSHHSQSDHPHRLKAGVTLLPGEQRRVKVFQFEFLCHEFGSVSG